MEFRVHDANPVGADVRFTPDVPDRDLENGKKRVCATELLTPRHLVVLVEHEAHPVRGLEQFG